MPATGVFAPERMLVAVRAIAPVAGRPPNRGEAMLATPCATSSTFGLCRSPLIRSATTADISDSMPPSMATVNAEGSSDSSRSARKAGIRSCGSPPGMPSNRDSMVSTGMPNTADRSVPPSSTTIVPGTAVFLTRHRTRMDSVTSETAVAQYDRVGKLAASVIIRPAKSPGTAPTVRPKKSRICVLAMTMAMPLVKPTTTGRGMKLIALPMPVAPSTTSMTPPIIVHMKSPSTPCCATMPETTTTNAPVGPPIWTIEPPSAEMRKPVTIAQ